MSLINAGDTQIFNYTGNIQEITLDKDGIYKLEVWGACGGGSTSSKGGYSVGYKKLNKGQTLYVVCGGTPSSRNGGGYNGGGSGQDRAGGAYKTGWGGGGATHIALVTGLLSAIGKSSFDINGLIVAGGGGGKAENNYIGGTGGGLTGGNGQGSLIGRGGTQTAGGSAGDSDAQAGSFGKGGSVTGSSSSSGTYGAGGGGAGYFGGGGASFHSGSSNSAGGGGGSGWIGNVDGGSTTNGVNDSNGYAKITLVVSYSVNPLGAGTISSSASGSTLSLTAIANSGYEFVNWLLKGYTQLEYIESSGTQWISTNYLTTSKTWVYAKLFANETGNKNWFGGTATKSDSKSYCFNSYSTSAIEFIYGNGDWTTKSVSNVVGKVFEVDFNKNNKVYINNTLIANLTTTKNTDTLGLCIFVRNGGTARISGRVYEFKIYENNILVRNYIPVIRHTDGAIGLLDLVQLKFYGNSGTGEFIGGNAL